MTKECPQCEGTGEEPNWYGCSDPECCGTPKCWECGGSGEMEEEE